MGKQFPPVVNTTQNNQILTQIFGESELRAILREEFEAVFNSITIKKEPPEQESQQELLTRAQVRKIFGVSLPTLINWSKSGVLPCIHFHRTVRYKMSEVNKLLQSKKGRV